jgi:hypothetical protein
MRVELDSMLEQLGPETPIAAKIRRQTLRDGHDAATTEIRKQGKAKPAAAATKVPADGVVKAMKEMEQELPGTRPDDPNQQSALAALWVEYRQLGGFHEFCRLGGSAEIPTLKDRLNTLKVLKANASALAAIDKLGPVHQQENLESRRALHLSVALDGLGRIRDESVSAPIKEWFDKARVAMDLGKLDESDNALAEAEKLLDIALNRIDRKEDEFAGRHEVVLDTINVVPQATPLHRKLMVDYRESLRRADEQDFDGCEKILKRLEGEAEKAAALATKA